MSVLSSEIYKNGVLCSSSNNFKLQLNNFEPTILPMFFFQLEKVRCTFLLYKSFIFVISCPAYNRAPDVNLQMADIKCKIYQLSNTVEYIIYYYSL